MLAYFRATSELARRTVRRSCAALCEPLGSQLAGVRGAPHVTSTRPEMSVLVRPRTRTSSPMRWHAARSRVGVCTPWSLSGEVMCVAYDVILAGPKIRIPGLLLFRFASAYSISIGQRPLLRRLWRCPVGLVLARCRALLRQQDGPTLDLALCLGFQRSPCSCGSLSRISELDAGEARTMS